MKNEPTKILSAQQSATVAELSMTYGIDPEDILFFGTDPRPFLTYEATCVMCNHLTNLHDISLEPAPAMFKDSIAYRCTLTLADGRMRSAVGVVNTNEKIDGKPMGEQQITQLASSRAIRNALKAAGIDLLKLHADVVNGDVAELKFQSPFAKSLAEAHALGTEAGLILGADKTSWYRVIQIRYNKNSSKELSQEELADFVGFLKALVPSQQKAA